MKVLLLLTLAVYCIAERRANYTNRGERGYPEFCELRRDGRYCDGPYVKYCIGGYNVMQYSCVSGCVSGTCVGAARECYTGPPKGSFCNGNQRFMCGRTSRNIVGYEYCPNGCSEGVCQGPEFTGCKNKNRGCECDSEGNVNCCSFVLMHQIKCGAGNCANATCQANSNGNSAAALTTTSVSVVTLVLVFIFVIAAM